VSRYDFRSALGGFFHANASRAAAALPDGLRPLESHPGLAVLAVTVFDFHASEVGPYQELLASIVVSPWAPRGEPLPHSAFFPVLLATSTHASRKHATERWRLPQLDRCLSIELDRSAGERVAVVRDERQVVLRLRVTETKQVASRRDYQCFAADPEHSYRVMVELEGQLSEHDDERGELALGDHPLASSLAQLLDDPTPFREQCMDVGVERFGELVRHAARGRTAS
jgi:hypothetical protein